MLMTEWPSINTMIPTILKFTEQENSENISNYCLPKRMFFDINIAVTKLILVSHISLANLQVYWIYLHRRKQKVSSTTSVEHTKVSKEGKH